MKIICTQAEKQWIADTLITSPVCPIDSKECGKITCGECVENYIEWEVTDGS